MTLRDKLRAMKSEEKKPQPIRESSLVVRESYEEIGNALSELDTDGLRRMGFEGEKPDREGWLFLDTETTGLSGGVGTLAFMVGLGRIEGSRFHITQYMLSDYPDEQEMLLLTAQILQSSEALVSFNGRNFDMPMLASRHLLLTRKAFPEIRQMDLLYPARRLYKRRLGSCRLCVLENEVLGLGREDDLPGSEAPARFFEYLKTGDAMPLEDVLRHNRQDVLSMVRLFDVLCAAYADPAGQEHRLDLFSMGRAMEKIGDIERAKECYALASKKTTVTTIEALRSKKVMTEADFALSMLLRREKNWCEAEAIWLNMAEKSREACIELAKMYEHQAKDITLALRYAKWAQKQENDEAIERRIVRLETKLEKEHCKNGIES